MSNSRGCWSVSWQTGEFPEWSADGTVGTEVCSQDDKRAQRRTFAIMRNWKTSTPGMTMREYVAGDQRANMRKGDKAIYWISGMVFEGEVLWIGPRDSYFRNKEVSPEAVSRQSSHWICSLTAHLSQRETEAGLPKIHDFLLPDPSMSAEGTEGH